MTPANVRRPFISRRNAPTRSCDVWRPKKEQVVLDMLKIVGRRRQQATNHCRIIFRRALQAFVFKEGERWCRRWPRL